MVEINSHEIIEKAHKEYYQIGSVPCPDFGGEMVYFNNHGWNHLLRRGNVPRDTQERLRRISLLLYAPIIVRVVRTIANFTEIIRGESKAHFWAAYQEIDNKKIRVVIRQLNGGRKHFFSIMEERN